MTLTLTEALKQTERGPVFPAPRSRDLVVYLAGAIRDGHGEDIAWREWAIRELGALAVIINPCGGKTYHPEAKVWTLHGRRPSGRSLVHHDFWAVDRADLIIFNLLPLAEGYASIGTLGEFFRSTGRSVLRYAIVKPGYTGHLNETMYQLHPFIEEHCTEIFPDVGPCLEFAREHLAVLSGRNPHYKGEL